MNIKNDNNYLKKELYELIKSDESIFDFIQYSSLDGLWYWDLENPENEWMNSSFWTTLGYNPEEMPHKSSAWQDIINQKDLEVALDNFTKHCENPKHPYDQIVRYRHKNNSIVWIRCRGMVIRNNTGKPIRMLGAHHDITRLKKTEQELMTSNKSKDKLFSIIAHDLRAPFNSLIGFSDLLIEKTSQSTDKELHKYSAIINESLNKTYNYLNNLLEWSRLQTNRIEFKPSIFYISDLVEEVKGILIAQAQNKEIHIKLSLQNNVELFADRNMIKVVLTNLVSNAIKYSNVGSEITISNKRTNKEDKIFVEDKGVGISKESCQQLFKVEESFSTPGTNNEKGTGLGLVLCNDFVKKHNGHIDVQSEIGKGSVFSVIIPINEEKE
jgi:hypothetical protein